ncbi:alpha/beta hydrolase [Streptomyces meridianus]|uniref:Alpha/beta fold hydrolase n=1 Tax=Streptomyces meridianus TaxID=2938945 RepID=A0ABT0XE35_9ACTN|nr:alpha/beta fold hydrolase [Streptomyces meridianus]MCM2580069.1 alpha/beta fold hydrolase [Streptomyces meridianus]
MSTVRRTVRPVDGEQVSVCTVEPGERAVDPHGVLVLHGAGNGDKERVLPLAEDFAALGHPAVALDFSGHGESSGALPELSLRRRRDQAAGVIEELCDPELPLILVGFSMSGQTVADLIEVYGERVAAVVLCAPGIYGRQAWDVPFGAGFTGLIRQPGSWRTSAAPAAYARFAGRAVLVLPERDDVIPAGVTSLIGSALTENADFSTLRLPGAGHQLGRWLAGQPGDRQRVVTAALRPASHHRTAEPASVTNRLIG